MTDDEMILISAVRYAMGRRSYIVSEAQRWVRERWERLGPQARVVLTRDLDEELEREQRSPGALGMEMDVEGWKALREWIKTASTAPRSSVG